MIDLPTHSTASDGTDAPAELVRLAARAGLRAVALTAHDTVDGLDEAAAAGERYGIEVVRGVELSAQSSAGPVHILGLWLPQRPETLSALIKRVRSARERRNRAVSELLAGLGAPGTYDEAAALSGGTLGRPHFAQVLVRRGLAAGFEDAFATFLGAGGRAYVPKDKVSAAEALAALRADGATPVLAHPCLLRLGGDALRGLLAELRDQGLEAVEAYYPEHADWQVSLFVRLAGDLGLAVTGGSDYHGAVKPGLRLGTGRGSLYVPDSLLDDLKARRRASGLA